VDSIDDLGQLMEHNDSRDLGQQILSRLGRIEHKVDSLDQTTAFALRADEDRHFETVLKIFKNSRRRVQVYLAVNGVRGVQEIAQHLKMQRQNVGPDLRLLTDEGLIEIRDTQGGKDIYVKKALDKSLRVSKSLQAKFNLGPSGLDLASGKSRKKGDARKS
jgi:DNA-binding transcriptional ArsR family regulator